jgi:hypothetical protein
VPYRIGSKKGAIYEVLRRGSPTRLNPISHALRSTDEERWAEALAIERIHGDSAHSWVIDRITQLGADRDHAGVARFMEIIDRLDKLAERSQRH